MTKPKVILWDADGVTIKRQNEYFSQRFAREYGAPLEEVSQFFKTEFRQCQLGKTDLIEELSQRLPKWGWQKGVSPFLGYWFKGDEADKAVLGKVMELRSRGIICCLATDQEFHRAAYISGVLGFNTFFDHLIFSCDLGFSKEDPAFFTAALKWLEVAPEEVQYWDDDEKNVEVAKSLGIDARFYKSFEDIANL